jgi:hypothetical protein
MMLHLPPSAHDTALQVIETKTVRISAGSLREALEFARNRYPGWTPISAVRAGAGPEDWDVVLVRNTKNV